MTSAAARAEGAAGLLSSASSRALAVRADNKAKSWELRRRSEHGAPLARPDGEKQQARELLAPVYGWFTEGFDTRDLKEAKALLGELGS